MTEFIFDDKENIDGIKKDISNIFNMITISNDIENCKIEAIKNIDYGVESEFLQNLLCSSEEHLRIMGHSLSPWLQKENETIFFNTLKRLIANKKEIKIIILMPYGNNLKYMNMGSIDEYSKKLQGTIKKFELFYIDLKDDEKQYFSVKYNGNHFIPYTYIGNERSVCISPYLFSDRKRSSFIVTFKSNSRCAGSFERDFDELFDKSDYIFCGKVNVISTFSSKMNEYSSKDWKYEDTYKYVFSDSCGIYEAGFYIHYDENKVIKNKTIELSTSYGCPFKCKYCASSSINNFQIIKEDTVLAILDKIWFDQGLSVFDNVHITFTGIGDFYFTNDLIFLLIPKIKMKYAGCIFTISSCDWNEKLIEKVEDMRLEEYIKSLQITFLSCNINKVKEMIPNYIDRCSIDELIKIIQGSELRDKFKINYIMIKDVNDSSQDFDDFIDKFLLLKDVIKVRISKLNETNCSRKNNLFSPDDSQLQEMEKKCKDAGFNAYIFSSKVNDNLNCGQLITELK